jgi:hypothetical protein
LVKHALAPYVFPLIGAVIAMLSLLLGIYNAFFKHP